MMQLLKANAILQCIYRVEEDEEKELSPSPLPGEISSRVLGLALGSIVQIGQWQTGITPEIKCYEKWLKDLGMFSLWETWLRENMVAIFKYLKSCQEKEVWTYSLFPQRIRENQQVQTTRKEVSTSLQTNFLTCINCRSVELAITWNGNSSSLEVFKQRLSCHLWEKFYVDPSLGSCIKWSLNH